jgi:hypothetical protein
MCDLLTGHFVRIVTGLFLLVIPALQLKGRTLRVRGYFQLDTPVIKLAAEKLLFALIAHFMSFSR